METICHVITKLELGGAQEVALHAVSHLDRERFRPVLVTGPGGLLTEKAQRIPYLELVILPWLARPIHAIADVMALLTLMMLFLRLRPTIVHTHSSKAGILGRWAAWVTRVPIIIHTIHGYGMTPDQPSWLRHMLMLLERMTGWITTHWIAVSKTDLQSGTEWGLFKENVSLIRPGIDSGSFQSVPDMCTRERLRRGFGADSGDLLVGTVTCLKPQKAPEDFVAVAERVCEAMPRAKFVLIGDGELRPGVEELIRQRGLQHHVSLAGWRRDIPEALQAMDAFLLTSHWEGLPRVILEARTAGLPVVATDVGGTREALIDFSDGYVSKAGDIAHLSENLIRVLRTLSSENSPMPKPLPREFHIEEMLEQYVSLYGDLLEGHRRVMPQTV